MAIDLFKAIEVSASGLSAQRERMNVASANLANAQTTRTEEGGPYRRRDVVLAAKSMSYGDVEGKTNGVSGVEVQEIREDQNPPRLEFDPGHPDANAEGYVAYPNVNVVEEMVDMITASRAYEAGITALDSAVSMSERALGIGR
jgi:flagellar basal-body rod protein FlgC